MAEQRLIDANALLDKQESLYMKGHVLSHGVTAYAIENAPTIDPETLTVVRQLREELAGAKAERDAAVGALKLTHDCNFCANDCVNPEQDYCALCHAKGCVCRTCRDGSNWVFQIPREEARP